MGETVISACGLGKKYVIGHQSRERHPALRNVLTQQGRRFLRSALDVIAGRPLVVGDVREEFWALKEVDVEISRGEAVGIIGRNGAGKTTLLKILSRITEPSTGRVVVKGRAASLLEVGTGFHPELSGRENIFLNGAILGMTRAEIRRRFDEIVDFAGVEQFLDTPVKRYSSGMYVRLAFAVAAHLEAEILLVDEVLAVGDAEFQRKCLGKMQDIAGGGRTVLFVSHNMAALTALCQRAILLQQGQVVMDGAAATVVPAYLDQGLSRLEVSLSEHEEREKGSCGGALRHLLVDALGAPQPQTGEPLLLRVTVDATRLPTHALEHPQLTLSFRDTFDRVIFTTVSAYQSEEPLGLERGEYEFECRIDRLPLTPGRYVIGVRLWTPGEMLDGVSPALSFEVLWPQRSPRMLPWSAGLGPVYVPAAWRWYRRPPPDSAAGGGDFAG